MFLGGDSQQLGLDRKWVRQYNNNNNNNNNHNNNNNNNPFLSPYIVADAVKESSTVRRLIINLVFTLIQKVLKDAESLLKTIKYMSVEGEVNLSKPQLPHL